MAHSEIRCCAGAARRLAALAAVGCALSPAAASGAPADDVPALSKVEQSRSVALNSKQNGVGTLTLFDARYYVRRLLRNRAGEAFASAGYYGVSCRRLSRLRMSCRFSAFAGDSIVEGSGQVW